MPPIQLDTFCNESGLATEQAMQLGNIGYSLDLKRCSES